MNTDHEHICEDCGTIVECDHSCDELPFETTLCPVCLALIDQSCGGN